MEDLLIVYFCFVINEKFKSMSFLNELLLNYTKTPYLALALVNTVLIQSKKCLNIESGKCYNELNIFHA